MNQEQDRKGKHRSPWAGVVVIAIAAVAVTGVVMLNNHFGSVREDVSFEQVAEDTLMSLEEVRTAEDEILTSYELVDTAAGVYRIPLERAIEIVAEESNPSSD